MSHPSVERLSTYLDERLVEAERRRLESHLEECSECHQRLQGMRRVMQRLETLDQQAPPPHLGLLLRRLAAQQATRPTLVDKLEKGARRFTVQATVAPVFAVVLALALIIYLLSWGIHRQEHGNIPVILETEPMSAAEEAPVAEEMAARSEVGARVGAVSAPASENAPEKRDRQPERRRAGRTFVRHGETWIEEGLDLEGAVDQLSFDDSVVQSWVQIYPELGELQSLGGTIRLRVEGRVVEIVFSPVP